MRSPTITRTAVFMGLALLLVIGWELLGLHSHWFPPHVVVWVGKLGFPVEGHTPEYALYLRGARAGEIQFTGDKLLHRYGGTCGCFQVHGEGDLIWGSNRIHFDNGAVQINGRQLASGQSHDFIVDNDGRVSEGFVKTAD